MANNRGNITETITTSNIDDIVQTLYNTDDELIGYSCKQVLEQNTVEPMDLIFYMDILSPNNTNSQSKAIDEAQRVILQELSKEYQIDPNVSKGVRCFDLPVDGSTWLVQLSIDTRNFKEITLFGGCKEMEWDNTTQDCKFYESRLTGSYVGAVATDEDGTVFSDVVAVLSNLINGPKVVQNLNKQQQQQGQQQQNTIAATYETLFLGVPRVVENPNFQGGADEGRDGLNDAVNIKTGINASQSVAQPNRKTITVVGGLLVACFSIAFVLIGYVLFRRRRSYNRTNNNNYNNHIDSNADLAVLAGTAGSSNDIGYFDGGDENNNKGTEAFAEHYNLDKADDGNDDNGGDDGNGGTDVGYDEEEDLEGFSHRGGGGDGGGDPLQDDEPTPSNQQQQQQQREQQQKTLPQEEEYPDLPMSAEAIQMDLGKSLKGQLMGLHGNTNINTGGPYGDGTPVNMVGGINNNKINNVPGGGSAGFFHLNTPTSVDGNESDDVDSWAQTEGTIGSLELQLEPITAEV